MKLTGIFVLFALCCACPGQSTESGSSTSAGTSIEGPSTGGGVVCQINPISPPVGTVGVVYPSIQMTASGCTAPLTWSISTGSLPGGLSFSGSGLISGTPTTAGSSSATVTLVDNLGHHPIFSLGVSISTSSGGAPTPPDPLLLSWNTTVANSPSPNTVVTVGDGVSGICAPSGCSYTSSQIATALTSVGCGQTLEIQNTPTALVYALNNNTLTMNQQCNSSNWLTIERDMTDATFPAEGQRVDPCYIGLPQTLLFWHPYPTADLTPNTCARHMPTLQQSGSSGSILISGRYIRFVGIDWGRTNTFDTSFGLVSLQNNGSCTAANTACQNLQAQHVIFDRNLFRADAQKQTVRGMLLGGCLWCAVIDSDFYDFQVSYAGGNGDAQAIAGGLGKYLTNVGEWKIVNDTLSASTMSYLNCGGYTEPLSPTTNADGIPHDEWWSQLFIIKNLLLAPQRGQALHETIANEGTSYPPVGDQEFIVQPSTLQLAQGSGYDLHTTWYNDSAGGLDRYTDAGGVGSITIDGTTYATINSANGILVKTSEHNVGSSPWQIPNAITYRYSACSGSGTPIASCTAATTPGNHVIIFNRIVQDGRYSANWPATTGSVVLGNNRTLSSSVTVTVVGTTSTSAGPRAPTAAVSGQSGSVWNNPTRVFATDGSAATSSITPSGFSQQLQASGFGFAIPATATINGIVVTDVVSATGTNITDGQFLLMKAGVPSGTAHNGHTWPLSFTSFNYGSSSDLWGLTLSPTDVNNSGFGIAMQAASGNAATQTASIDSVTITVYYTTTGTPTPQIAISPSATDLQIQPSYPGAGTTDAYGNSRQFSMLFFETPNYTQSTLTYQVDGITGGNASVGTIQSGVTGLVTGESVYTAGSSTGTHTISVSDASASASQTINVNSTAPILAFDLKAMTSKNCWESKCISRGLLNYSILENTWGSNGNGGGQPPYCILNQPINQANQTLDGNGVTVNYGPEYVSDFAADHIHCLHTGAGFTVASLNSALGIHRLSYSSVLLEDMNCPRWGTGFLRCLYSDALQYSGTASKVYGPNNISGPLPWTSATTPLADNINFNHITAVGGTSTIPGTGNWISQANNNVQYQLGPFSFTNSIVLNGGSTTFANNNGESNDCNTVSGSGATNNEARMFLGPCYTAAVPFSSTYSISRNALVDNTASISGANWPSFSTLWQPTDSDATLFRSYVGGNGGDYRVVSGGQYDAGGTRDASDSSALGADVQGILNSDAAVRAGTRTP